VASKLLPKSEAVQLTEIQRTLQAGRQFLQEVTEKIQGVTDLMSQAANNFNTVLVDTVQKMEGIGSDLHRSARDIQHTLLQASEAVQESTHSLQESARSLSTSSDELREYHRDMRSAYESLLRLFDKSRQDLEDLITRQLNRIGEYREAIQHLSEAVVHRLIDVSSNLKDTQTRYTEAHRETLQANHEVREAIHSAFESLRNGLAQVLEAHRDEMRQVDGRLREVADALRTIAENTGISTQEQTPHRGSTPHSAIVNIPSENVAPLNSSEVARGDSSQPRVLHDLDTFAHSKNSDTAPATTQRSTSSEIKNPDDTELNFPQNQVDGNTPEPADKKSRWFGILRRR
jgi:ABC-type transporter Mla subunit MlaD